MMIKKIILACTLSLAASLSMARTWTNAQGKAIEAEWVRVENDQVVVQLPNGREARIALKSLSGKDREYVKNMQGMDFSEKSHIWTLPDGRLLSARLEAVEPKFVTVSDEKGKRIKIFISELSEDDKAFVVSEARKIDSGKEREGHGLQFSIVSVDAVVNAIKKGDLKTIKSYIDQGGNVNVLQNGLSLLSIAVEANQLSITKLLISGGADLEFQDQWGSSPLMRASRKGCFDIVKQLLASGAKLDVIHTDSGKTTLMVAIEGNNPQIVKLLIDHGADVLSKNAKSGQTPMRVARTSNVSPGVTKILEAAVAARKAKILDEGGQLQEDDGILTPNEVIKAVENNDKALLKEYIDQKGNLDVKGSDDWWSPLCLAAEDGKLDIARILLDGGANIDFPNIWEATPLMCATCRGRLDIVKLLLLRGADVNATDDRGLSPIFAAVSSKNIQIIKLLIDNGADVVTKREKSGSTLLQYARENESPSHIIKLLESAVAVQKAKMKANGEMLPEEDDTLTPGEMSLAMRKGDKTIVQKYISGKFPLNIRNRNGMSLLCVASELKKTDFLKMLLEAGADVEYPCGSNRTALGVAANNGNLEHAMILIQAGAALDQEDNDRMTPLLCAINGNHHDIIKFLLSQGAGINLPSGRGEKDIVDFAKKCKANPKVVKLLKEALEKQGK